jgi:hypothetical protein
MANSHGLSSRLVKKQAAARKLAKKKKSSTSLYWQRKCSAKIASELQKANDDTCKIKKHFPKQEASNQKH